MMRTKVNRFWMTGLAALLATGLSAQPPAKKNSADSTLGGQWYLLAVLPSDTATGRVPRILFNLGTHSFSGNTGCNAMRGTFSLTDSTLAFNENLITTKMACVGYDEGAFLRNLLRVTGYRIRRGTLILLAADGTEVSHWTRRIAKPKKTETAHASVIPRRLPRARES